MPSSLEAAGAVREPSEYATLSMDRAITGLWTQRSPLRDADVPYLYGKFYSASRFDSLIDGVNREITARLTYARRPGLSVYNSNTFPAINSFFSFKRISSGSEIVRVIADGSDGNVYDATAGQKTTILTKASGAGKARFEAIGTTLYMADGVENLQWMQPAGWVEQTSLATTQYAVGTLILDSNGDLEYLYQAAIGSITHYQIIANTIVLTFSSTNFNVSQGMQFFVTGVSSQVNNIQLFAASVVSSGGTFIVTAVFNGTPHTSTAVSGTAFTQETETSVTTGTSQPSWPTVGNTVVDGNATWKNFGSPVQSWGESGADFAPTLSNVWQPLASFAAHFFIVDNNGFIETAINSGTTGPRYPTFRVPSTPAVNNTGDGSIRWELSLWLAGGTSSAMQRWAATVTPYNIGVAGGDVCIDSNANLQMVTAGSGATGSSEPTWNTTVGGTTTDSGLTWTNLGPSAILAYTGESYGFAYHFIDGSVSTLSPFSISSYGVLADVVISGPGSGNPMCDSVWIFSTADGQATPIYLATVPNVPPSASWGFTRWVDDSVLQAEIAGPQSDSNNPPPVGMTAPCFHEGRIFAIYENTVICSGGPDTLVGNGFTAFPPLNNFPMTDTPIRLVSGVTNQGPTLFIWATTNIWAIYGTGTSSNPFTQASVYMADVGIQSYDAVTRVGSTWYAMTGKSKVISLDPSAGYIEVGFPIGDQFMDVSTGAGGYVPNSGAPVGALYTPSETFVTWCEIESGDSAMYVCDGQVGWFRLAPVASPETGFLWSPRAVIVGGTSAVQGIQTSPGIQQLLVGPQTSGSILYRNPAVNADNGTAYPSYDVKGNIVLCESGEVAEIAHIALKSAATGAKPIVGLLLGEIAASENAPFHWIEKPTSSDPPDLPASNTLYSDRYSTEDGTGNTPKCDNFQLCVDYGTQNFADELLKFSIYGAKHS